ncbi:MAG TPA: hypothetical protein PKZ76_15195, partial [Xanthomonadaceae bacterium]|nr:hypothetical protein [Xanthomonadaceae bacterium]
ENASAMQIALRNGLCLMLRIIFGSWLRVMPAVLAKAISRAGKATGIYESLTLSNWQDRVRRCARIALS